MASQRPSNNNSGIALFMVMGAIAILAVLVVEFTYTAKVNQIMAFSAFDRQKALYLAQSGFKLSLLRLKAYQQVNTNLSNMNRSFGTGGGESMVPKNLIEKIWSFPIIYPFPKNLPGMTRIDKDNIDKFQKESNLEGSFSAIIESESSKYNLNLITAKFGTPTNQTPNPNSSPSPSPSPVGTPSAAPSFDPRAAMESLTTFLGTILNQKFEAEPDFAANYRDLRLEDLVDNIMAWSNPGYERRTSSNRDRIPMKRAPFYALSELHYLSTIDDAIYDLITPSLTVSPTGGINVNSITQETLHALIPSMSKDELKEFFKYRDSEEFDHYFKQDTDFFDYLSKNVASFQAQSVLDNFKRDLATRNLRIVTEEKTFKITVQAQVNSSIRKIEAWVTLGDSYAPNTPGSPPRPNPSGTPNPAAPTGSATTPSVNATGLTITYMKVQ